MKVRSIQNLKAFGNASGRVPIIACLAFITMLATPAAAHAGGDANTTVCTSATEASPGFRTYLPDCRAYELVTPPYDEGARVALRGPAAISPDGAHVITGVCGAFAGADNDWWQGNRNPFCSAYEFTRGPAGWTPAVLTPPATEFPHSTFMAAAGNSLDTTLWGAATNTLTFNEDIYVRHSEGDFALVGPGTGPEVRDESLEQSHAELNLVGASRELTHEIFLVVAFGPIEREAHRGHGNLWPGTPQTANRRRSTNTPTRADPSRNQCWWAWRTRASSAATPKRW